MYRQYRIPTVWHEMNRLQSEMGRLFATYYPERVHQAPAYPALNVWTNDEGLNVTAEVPGVSPDDIEISVVGDTLTLKGTRQPEELDENVRYHRQERGYGDFTRSLQLPFQVDVDKVEATFHNGVLMVAMPRAEEDMPRKITVKSA
jgi:HSP20 family protein